VTDFSRSTVFTVFGRLAAHRDGVPVELGPAKQRLVLGALLSRPGETVSAAELTELVWGPAPPASARQNLRTYIHHLRAALGDDVLVRTGHHGYQLASAGAADANRFAELVRAGARALHDGGPQPARRHLTGALRTFSGTPYGPLAGATAVAVEVARLEQLRVTALLQRVELDLAAGLADELLPELDEATRRYPVNERLHALHMLALYRAGRPADALAAYRSVRDALVRTLGLDPSVELRYLHQAMLRRDPRLDAPVRAAPGPLRLGRPADAPRAGRGAGRVRRHRARRNRRIFAVRRGSIVCYATST
jgi:DNA-binding SARP family transcriptional activator